MNTGGVSPDATNNSLGPANVLEFRFVAVTLEPVLELPASAAELNAPGRSCERPGLATPLSQREWGGGDHGPRSEVEREGELQPPYTTMLTSLPGTTITCLGACPSR